MSLILNRIETNNVSINRVFKVLKDGEIQIKIHLRFIYNKGVERRLAKKSFETLG